VSGAGDAKLGVAKIALSASGQSGASAAGRVFLQWFIPRVGQRVRVVGQDDVFIVIRVDRCRYAADLVQMHGARQVETGVSLLAIRPMRGPGKSPTGATIDLEFAGDATIRLTAGVCGLK